MGKRLVIPGADFFENAIDGEKAFTLQQGYASATASGLALSIGSLSTRVITNQLIGSYTIKTNSGYAIRAIVTYTTSVDIPEPTPSPAESIATTDAVLLSDVQGLTEYTLVNPGAYSIITFCKTDATQDILPTENIVKALY